jgi:hypothetical protein
MVGILVPLLRCMYYSTVLVTCQPVGLYQTLTQLANPDQLAVIDNYSIAGYDTDSNNAVILAKPLADRINCQHGADVEPTPASKGTDIATELIAYCHYVECWVDVHIVLLVALYGLEYTGSGRNGKRFRQEWQPVAGIQQWGAAAKKYGASGLKVRQCK